MAREFRALRVHPSTKFAMLRRLRLWACVLCLVPSMLATAQVAPAPAPAAPAPVPAAPATGQVAPAPVPEWKPVLEGRALLDALRKGGYVIYLRHTSTDFGQNDETMTSFADCTKQRNLTDQGRAEARAIGSSLRKLRVRVGAVLAGPFCRTVETARLAFGEPQVSHAVRGGPARPDAADRYAELRGLLATRITSNTNTAISSHGNPFFAVTGPPYLAEGEAAIVEPQDGARFRIVARVKKDAWLDLAQR
ncbi:MAG: histidine phosphatase family protein [Casimicrobiaceae bacterium]